MQLVNQILTKPVNRKQFLGHIGVAALAITGIPLLLKSLHELGGPHLPIRASGYGSMAYGGGAPTQKTSSLFSAPTPSTIGSLNSSVSQRKRALIQ